MKYKSVLCLNDKEQHYLYFYLRRGRYTGGGGGIQSYHSNILRVMSEAQNKRKSTSRFYYFVFVAQNGKFE